MTYPVYIGDRAAGTMTVTAAGQDTVFELRCPDPEPGLWRAWVQGEEGRLDLGTEGDGAHVGVVPVVHPLLEGQKVVHGLLAVVGILE